MATKANLLIDQGTTFVAELNLADDNDDIIDLTNHQANSQMRKWYTSSNAAATFTTSINTYSGSITLSLTATQTSSLSAGRYVYDVEIRNISTNAVSRILEGIVTVTPECTR